MFKMFFATALGISALMLFGFVGAAGMALIGL